MYIFVVRAFKFAAAALLLMVGAVAVAQDPPAAPTRPPAASEPIADEASSYATGMTFGEQMRSAGIEHAVSLEPLARGIKDSLGGKALSDEDRERVIKLVRAGRDALAERNHQAAKDFLAQNGKSDGMLTTTSGLQIKVLTAGDQKAESAKLQDRVVVNYRGRLLDGTEFDNSEKHAQPVTFAVASVIKGWQEALQLMKPGAKWRFYVPPELGYDVNSPPSIPPGSLLIFDCELVRVEPANTMGALPHGAQPAIHTPKTAHHTAPDATPAPAP